MHKRWNIKDSDPQLQAAISNKLDIHPIVAQLLVNRGVTQTEDIQSFLHSDISRLHDPFLMKDMKKAVMRIKEAQKKKEKVLVFGDYDVDGVTSSAIMHDIFKELGLEVINHIPHRVHDGYGLNHEIAEDALNEGVSLLITVDCGITAVDEVETLNKHGIDVIVVDHHIPDEKLPNALAIINPKQPGCHYPFKELATVGLVAKLSQALFGMSGIKSIDLVALGTIADIAPLRGENRIFVKEGLPKITKTKNLGLEALMKVTRIDQKELKPFHIGFVLGPRINAAGRMDTAHIALDLLLSENREEALRLAKELEAHNTKRQKMQRSVTDEAIDIVEQEINFKNEKVIVLSKEGWHKGVLGIVASRIAEKYYRPSIVISLKDGVGTASARSIDGFHLQNALQNCSSCLENYGGHEAAAGLTIKEENIDPFKDLINTLAQDILQAKKLVPSITIDCEVPLSSLNLELAEIIDTMQPFGRENPSPVVCTRKLAVQGRSRVLGRDTLKFWVTDGRLSVSAVGFGMAKFQGLVDSGELLDLAYEISIDDWNKAPTVQMLLKDIRINEEQHLEDTRNKMQITNNDQ